MKLAKLKAVGIVAGVAALSFITTPASALGTVTTLDPAGWVDVDASCVISTSTTNPPPNNIASPGAPGGGLQGGAGCEAGISTYDGSTRLTDLVQVDLSSHGLIRPPHSNVGLRALFHVNGPIPAAGNTSLAAADLPDPSFVAFSYRVMYQNTTRQTNTPYIAATRLTGTPIYGLNEHWQDGFHKFIAFDAAWVGTHWMHSVSVGTYDSGPDGAFYFTELGVSNSAGVWNAADPTCMPYGTWNVSYPTSSMVSIEVDGVTRFANIQSTNGCINDEYVKAGDNIVNVKGLSTADSTVTLPVTIPLSLIPGESDITSVGGFLATSDYTLGNSRNVGLVGTALQPNRVGLPYSGGAVGLVDTLGDGPRCWTSTFGGLLPSNPLWVADQPCYIDDDVVPGPSGNIDPGLGRGSIFEEWWDTIHGFTA